MHNENTRGNSKRSKNTKNLSGDITYLVGDFNKFSGCASRICGDSNSIKLFTTNLDDIQELIKKYKLGYIYFEELFNFILITISYKNVLHSFSLYKYNRDIRTLDLEILNCAVPKNIKTSVHKIQLTNENEL